MAPKPDGGDSPGGNWGGTTDTSFPWFDLNDFNWPTDILTTELGISELKPWVMNQQPAHISALADQYVNAQSLLAELMNTIRAHSTKLYNETWTHSDARDSFMQRGPGKVLAYLQQWHTSLGESVLALRKLVDPVQTSQTEMDALYKRYEQEVAKAKDPSNIGFGEFLSTTNPHWYDYVNPLSGFDDEGQIQQHLIEKVNAVKKDFDRQARELVSRLNGAYEYAWRSFRWGIGPTYEPPNVVMVPPGKDLPPLPAGVPGGMPGGVPAGPSVSALPTPPPAAQPVMNVVAPPAPPPVAPAPPPNAPTGPNAPSNVPAGAPVAPPSPVPAGGLAALPPPAPGFGNVKLPGAAPGLAGKFAPGALPGGAPAAAPGLGNGMVPPPGLGKGLSKGVLRKPGAPPTTPGGGPGSGMLPPPGAGRLGKRRQPPGSTLRSPAANYTATGTPGVPGGHGSGTMPPPAPGSRRRQPGGAPVAKSFGQTDVPEAFSRSSMPPPVSPVLGRPQRRKRTEEPTAPGATRGSFAPPAATPPVLDASTARPAGMSLPPGGIPPQRSRRDRRSPGSPGTPSGPGFPGSPLLPGGMPPGRQRTGDRSRGQQSLVGNPEWLTETGPDELASTAPVLRNQVTAPDTEPGAGSMLPRQPGATSPVLGRPREAVRRAMAQNRSRPAGRQPTDTELELARRVVEADHQGRPVAEVPAREGEEAFTVQTPGGAVVGGSGPVQPEPAPKPLISNG